MVREMRGSGMSGGGCERRIPPSVCEVRERPLHVKGQWCTKKLPALFLSLSPLSFVCVETGGGGDQEVLHLGAESAAIAKEEGRRERKKKEGRRRGARE